MYWFFDLETIPDLSLTKYMSLDESGVEGVLSKHSSFLRQLNRKGLLSKVFFHLLYTYNPNEEKGGEIVGIINCRRRQASFNSYKRTDTKFLCKSFLQHHQ